MMTTQDAPSVVLDDESRREARNTEVCCLKFELFDEPGLPGYFFGPAPPKGGKGPIKSAQSSLSVRKILILPTI